MWFKKRKPLPPPDPRVARYVCSMCTYIYDPAENKGVPFVDLPDEWVCPVCDVSKDEFELLL